MKKIVNISYHFLSKEKKSLCFLKIRVLKLLCIDMLFHKIQGNGGARGASHIALGPKSDLNEIYHLSVREIMTTENMISQVKFC